MVGGTIPIRGDIVAVALRGDTIAVAQQCKVAPPGRRIAPLPLTSQPNGRILRTWFKTFVPRSLRRRLRPPALRPRASNSFHNSRLISRFFPELSAARKGSLRRRIPFAI